MTLDELQAMSNDELNELAAVNVMGYEKKSSFHFLDQDGFIVYIWNPAGDMNQATELLNVMVEDQSNKYNDVTITYPWCVVAGWNVNHDEDESAWEIHVSADFLPRAITIAAILAKASE